MKPQGRITFCRISSWLLIYLSIALGCWRFNEGHQVFVIYGDARIVPGALTAIVALGMLILGVCLFLISDSIRTVTSFITGLVVEILLLAIMVSGEGVLGVIILCYIPNLPWLGLLKIIRGISGYIISLTYIQNLLFLFQILLPVLYFKKIRKIHWGFIALKLAVISIYALFSLYNNGVELWALSFFSMLTLVWLAEIPWLWVDTPAKCNPQAEKSEAR